MAAAREWFTAQTIVVGHANHPTVTTVYGDLVALIRDRGLRTVTLADVWATPTTRLRGATVSETPDSTSTGPRTTVRSDATRVADTSAAQHRAEVEAHRPLGNIMRVRRHVYPVAAGHRSKLTGCPLHEPSTLPDL